MTESLSPPAPPQHSPDGRWWWDGQQWLAVPVATPPPPPTLVPTPGLGDLGTARASVSGIAPMSPAHPANLISGERVIFQGRLHPVYPYLAAGLTFAAAVFVGVVGATSGVPRIAVPFLVFAAVFAVVGYVRTKTTEFVLTNRKISFKAGVLHRRSLETLLTKVEGVSIKQDVFGSVLGYGSLVVNGVGGTREAFAGVANPQVFRHAIQEEIATAGAAR